jgi:segregation and condensation protein A
MKEALANAPKPPQLGKVVIAHRVRIRDKINLIVEAIKGKGRTSFRTVLRRVRSRLEIVISFLAVLELVKSRKVIAEQSELFGEIELLPGKEWESVQDVEIELEFDE